MREVYGCGCKRYENDDGMSLLELKDSERLDAVALQLGLGENAKRFRENTKKRIKIE